MGRSSLLTILFYIRMQMKYFNPNTCHTTSRGIHLVDMVIIIRDHLNTVSNEFDLLLIIDKYLFWSGGTSYLFESVNIYRLTAC